MNDSTSERPLETRPESQRVPDIVVVGIGASAGGLDALGALMTTLTPGNQAAYVIAQHLDPKHRSLLTRLLDRHTDLEVVSITGNRKLRPGVVFVTPPDRHVIVAGDRLKLLKPRAETGPKPSIDKLFCSLAEEYEDHAIGVILSGSGSDGARGITEIKAAGGLTIAQEPATAQFASMPRAAIGTGGVDLVLPPEQIGAELHGLADAAGRARMESLKRGTADTLKEILSLLRESSGQDFSSYKCTTLLRRISRRAALSRFDSIDDYLVRLQGDPDELETLRRDILVTVTSFFRDPEAFAALRQELEKLLAKKSAGDAVRIWVPGCATGEEAYSIAIELVDALGERFGECKLQIFATDIDESHISRARKGIYTAAALANVPRETLARHFMARSESFQVNKDIRDLVIFAKQDMLRDPPFARLDLISCRNVLIYFNNRQQQQLLSVFNYVLVDDGLLFLGRSENLGPLESYFTTVDRHWRLFKRRRVIQPQAVSAMLRNETLHESRPLRPAAPRAAPRATLEQTMDRALSEHFGPAGVLLDDQMVLQYVRGDVSQFLKLQSGEAPANVVDLVLPELKVAVQTLLRRVAKEDEPLVVARRRVDGTGGSADLRICAARVSEDRRALFLLTFESEPVMERQDEAAENDESTVALERELEEMRAHLRVTVEELESTNQELQSTNQELQSANEELYSANEQLHTSNEELQSTNEELSTVNDELREKSAEFAAARSQLEAILRNVDQALVLVDSKLRIRCFSREAARYFDISLGDVGSAVTSLPTHLAIPNLRGILRRAVDRNLPVERELTDSDRNLLLRVTPMQSGADRQAGAILSLIDVTEHERAEQLRLTALNVAPVAMIMVNSAGTIVLANTKAERVFGYPLQGMLGKSVDILVPRRHRRVHERHMAEFMAQLGSRDMGVGREFHARRKDGSEFLAEIGLTPLEFDGEVHVVGTIVDASEREHWRRIKAQYELMVSASADLMAVVDRELRFLAVNDTYLDYHGREREELIGKTMADVLEPEDFAGRFKPWLEACLEGEPASYRTWYEYANRGRRLVEARYNPYLGPQGNIEGVLVTVRDVTDATDAASAEPPGPTDGSA